jgi:hypothetical protein
VKSSNLRIGIDAAAPRLGLAAAPDVAAAQSFEGLAASDEGGSIEPPDPWIAVNGSYVIQAVNSLVRISTRGGTTVETLPTWALWGLPPDQLDSDPRIIWDSFHSRWVGVLISFNAPDFTDNFWHLIVSETADPLGAWDVYSLSYGPILPDYPAIASSTDRIVLSSNDFDSSFTYLGPTLWVVPWSGILAGGTVPLDARFYSDSYFTFRPAQVLSSSATVHVIGDLLGEVVYIKVAGSATAPTYAETNITDSIGVTGFSAPIDPRNSDGSTIGPSSIDERPTDAVWRNNRLWWVSTVSWDAGGSVFYDAARASFVTTTATTPTVGAEHVFAFDGYDTFMPGVGISGDDTVFIPMTVSSDGDNLDPSTVAFRWNPTDGFNTTSPYLDRGDAPYTGERWGDYVGVAADPSGSATAWVADEVSSADGKWRTTVKRLTVDATAPTATAPVMSVVYPSTLTSSVPVKLTWSGSDAGSGVASYKLEQNIDAVGWETIESSTTRTSVTRVLPFGHNYQYRVTAVDGSGNESPAVTSAKFAPYLYQQTASNVAYSGSWSTYSGSNYSGGTVRATGTAGRSATLTATNARSIAFVTTKATSRGSFKVYIDGVYKKTVSAYGSTKYRQILYQASWSTPGTHKMKIVVSGTSGHPRVDADAFVALRVVP